MTSRRDELAARLAAVHSRVSEAVARAGRDDEPAVIAVTKYFPATDVELLIELGVRDIGESKDQEASAKLDQISARQHLTVHFVGQLQTNKARSVARYADVVHSVDRLRLVHALNKGAGDADRTLGVLIQVCLDDRGSRGGVAPDEALALADAAASAPHLNLLGVMAVAPREGDPAPAFERLREVADGIQAVHRDATWISAGMSTDLEAAIAVGATHLRVGSAILGTRPSLG